MAQTNYTPISLYYSTTASAVPTAANLVPGELAINTADGKLYYEDSSGVVQVLATKSTGSIGGSNTQVQFNNSGSLGGSSGLTWDGSFLTTSSIKNSALTSGRVTYAGASGLLSDSASLTFDGTSLTTPRLVLGGTTLPSAGTATLFSRTSDNNTYLQTGSGNNFNLLDGSQNTMATFSPTALSFNISNTAKLTLNSTSLYTASGINVGIGTSSPSYNLDVVGTGSIISATRSDTNRADIIVTNTGGTVSFGINNASGSWLTNGLAYYGYILGPTNSSYGLQFGVGASNTAALTISPSGNLGLGVTPSAWGGVSTGFQIGLSGYSSFSQQSSGATNLMSNAYEYTSNAWKYIATANAGKYTININDGSHAWYNAVSGTAGNVITFTQAMTLDASGNLLVGTTSSYGGEKFTLDFTGSTQRGMVVRNTTSTTQDSVAFIVNSTFVGWISASTTATSYNTISDYRLKENVVPMTGALAKVAQLKPVTYKWKTDGSDGQGFIAHELAEVCPSAVSGYKDAVDENGKIKPQGVDTSFLVATLVSAIQELKAEFDAYKATHP
jgi:hypothetical protein